MTPGTSARLRLNARRSGFTIVECVISTVIVAVMLVAVLQTLGASKRSQLSLVQSVQGQTLAQSLMTEILPREYEDPNGSSSLGLDAGETYGIRTDYDDVDDYEDWVASPPRYEDGTSMSELAGWQREVSVAWVDPDDPAAAAGAESGGKRITVTVLYYDRPVHVLTALRSAHGF
jgi:prepilin-type N-terminal cleavage/methylation domain-containing protein